MTNGGGVGVAGLGGYREGPLGTRHVGDRRDVVLDAVFLEREVAALQADDRASLTIGHARFDLHQADFDPVIGLLRRCGDTRREEGCAKGQTPHVYLRCLSAEDTAKWCLAPFRNVPGSLGIGQLGRALIKGRESFQSGAPLEVSRVEQWDG